MGHMIDCSHQADVPDIDQHTVIIRCFRSVLEGLKVCVGTVYMFHQYRTGVRVI